MPWLIITVIGVMIPVMLIIWVFTEKVSECRPGWGSGGVGSGVQSGKGKWVLTREGSWSSERERSMSAEWEGVSGCSVRRGQWVRQGWVSR